MLPNGDCFFAAVATTLISDVQTWQHPLSLIGATNDVTVATLAGILREAFVRELLGERQSNYEAFVAHTNMDYTVEANKFCDKGYFDSELGNTMPLALSTAKVYISRIPVTYGISHKDVSFT